jgi:hypothetical protein
MLGRNPGPVRLRGFLQSFSPDCGGRGEGAGCWRLRLRYSTASSRAANCRFKQATASPSRASALSISTVGLSSSGSVTIVKEADARKLRFASARRLCAGAVPRPIRNSSGIRYGEYRVPDLSQILLWRVHPYGYVPISRGVRQGIGRTRARRTPDQYHIEPAWKFSTIRLLIRIPRYGLRCFARAARGFLETLVFGNRYHFLRTNRVVVKVH